jgi:hypothetical protein
MQGHRLFSHVVRTGLAVLTLAALCDTALAQVAVGSQLPSPRLFTVTPSGAKAGTTIEMTFAGSDLDDPQALLFTHAGIKAEPIIPPLPPPPKPDPKKDPKKPAPPPPPRPPVTKFKVTIGADVPIGFYDVRLANKWGVSNPRTFVVGELKEVGEKEPNNDIDQAQRVEIGTTISGTIANAVDVDYTVFSGKKGRRLLISCTSGSMDSRLNPELRLFDSAGRQLAYHRPALGGDALIDAALPDDGDYYIRLCQFTYTAGSPEFFYRLNISTGPWIDAIVPPMVEPGKATELTIYGRNLPGGKPDAAATMDGRPLEKISATVTAPKDPLALQRLGFSGFISPVTGMMDGFEYRLKSPGGMSNPFLLTFAQAPVVLEKDNNDTPESAQEVTLPVEIAGRIDKRGDRDWFSFSAKKGDVYMIEVYSHRLGAPTDMYFSLRNPATKAELVQLDDMPAPLSTKLFYNLTRDPPAYRFVVPADGKYQLLVGSHLADNQAEPHHFYRLRIAREAPDFRVVVMAPDEYRPDSCVLGQGGNRNYSVFVDRRDNFKGEVALSVEGLPTGVTCPAQVVGSNLKKANLVVSAAMNAPAWTGEIKVRGTAVINGVKVVREARSASIVWPVQPQQNIPTLTRLDRSLVLAVRDKAPYSLTVSADKTTITHGDKVKVKLALNRIWPDMKTPAVQILPIPNEMPPGISFPNVNIPAGKGDGAFDLNVPTNVVPGSYAIVFRSFAPVPFSRNPKDMKKPAVNVVEPSTPLLLTVLPKQVANLSATPNINLKLNTKAEIIVTTSRLHEFEGPFKVQLVLPPNVKGLSVAEAAIPGNDNQAKLIVSAAADAPVANYANLVVRATAVVNGNVTLTHETKISINVVK